MMARKPEEVEIEALGEAWRKHVENSHDEPAGSVFWLYVAALGRNRALETPERMKRRRKAEADFQRMLEQAAAKEKQDGS